MTTIAFASLKGSPGTTITALALAYSWSEKEPTVLAEVDCDGGDLAGYCDLSLEDKSLFSLSISARRENLLVNAIDHSQTFGKTLPVVAAPVDSSKVVNAVGVLGDRLLNCLDVTDHTAFVDVGRLRNESQTTALLKKADHLVIVARPTLQQASALRARLETLQALGTDFSVLLVGDHPYGATEFSSAVGIEVAGVISNDRRGVEAFLASPNSMLTKRSLFLRSTRKVADSLMSKLAEPVEVMT